MVPVDDRLKAISDKLREREDVSPVTVRDFLSWFGAQRRSFFNVMRVRTSLGRVGLITDPDFESAYIDSEIRFQIAPDEENEGAIVKDNATEALPAQPSNVEQADPTYRISKLAAANKVPLCVAPDVPLKDAVTLMMASDFSQLPITTSEREIKGMISWSSIGSRLVLSKDHEFVRDVMDVHHEIRADASMFQAIPVIVEHGYVLIRGADNALAGIVTASDLSLQFQQLAEPFLLLGEIENHIRSLLTGKFESTDFLAVRDPSDTRKVEEVSDLSFGEYVRLLENNVRWEKVSINLDRKIFCSRLDEVRKIRNDVMHFDPDGILPNHLEQLRDFSKFLQRLRIIGAY